MKRLAIVLVLAAALHGQPVLHAQTMISGKLGAVNTQVQTGLFSAGFNSQSSPWCPVDGNGKPAQVFGYRLWDDGVKLSQIFVSSLTPTWTSLDNQINNRATGGSCPGTPMNVIYTFGSTPQWASNCSACADPSTSLPGPGGSGFGGGTQCASPSDYSCMPFSDVNTDGTGTDANFVSMVKQIVTRYASKITYYEAWNEADSPNFDCFQGAPVVCGGGNPATTPNVPSLQRRIRMAWDAYNIEKCLAPNSKALSPSFHGPTAATWYHEYNVSSITSTALTAGVNNYPLGCPTIASQTVTGKMTYDYSNIHARPSPNSIPENMITTYNAAVAEVALDGLPNPTVLFNDEFGYNTSGEGGGNSDAYSSYVARSYVLCASLNFAACYWYQWDTQAIGLSQSPQGSAYDTVASWLINATPTTPCAAVGTIWQCGFSVAGTNDVIAWDTSQNCAVLGSCTTANHSFGAQYAHYQDLAGVTHSSSKGTGVVALGIQPILLLGSTATAQFTLRIIGGGVCAPPTYLCDYTATDVVQTPAPPFSANTPVNTVVQESILSHAHISRVTDANTGAGPCNTSNQWNATPSGGSSDVITNTNGTLLLITCSGGRRFVVGFNPTTLQVYPASPTSFVSGMECDAGVSFSRVDPLLLYCRAGTVVNKVVFQLAAATNLCGLGVGQCPDVSVSPVSSQFFDFASCQFAQAIAPSWGSILGVGANDLSITEALSWTGGQGTGRYVFYYVPNGGGCSTFDTQGNGTNPIWYDSSHTAHVFSSITATWTIHDVTSTGPWVSIQATGCVGSSCGTGDGPPTWQANTNNLLMLQGYTKTSGHHDYSLSNYINDGNPQIYQHPLTNPATVTQIGNIPCDSVGCSDIHFNGNIYNDTDPMLGTTSTPNATWLSPYRNEVVGISTDGSGKMWRFGKTYSTGTSATNFYAHSAIGAPSQTRCVYFFTSDMLGNLGTVAGLNRGDIFAMGLCGQ